MVVQNRDVGGVQIIGTAHLCSALHVGCESRVEPPLRRPLVHELRSVEHAGAVGDPVSVEAERVDHAVAVEPVAIAHAEAFMDRRPVAVQRPPKLRRQSTVDARVALDPIGVDTAPAEQGRIGCEGAGKSARPALTGRERGGESQGGQAREAGRPQETPPRPGSHGHQEPPVR